MKLDLACGRAKKAGYCGVDKELLEGVDVVWNLEQYPWNPFPDNSVEEVYCSHYIEHTSDLIRFMDEIWRICADRAAVHFVAPYYTSMRAWQDPTHTRPISEATFLYFQKDWRVQNRVDHYTIQSNFNVEQIEIYYNPPWDSEPEDVRAFARRHYWNVVSEIRARLVVVK